MKNGPNFWFFLPCLFVCLLWYIAYWFWHICCVWKTFSELSWSGT